VPTTSRGRVARWGFSIQIFATVFLTSLMVEESCDGVGFRTISLHPAGAMRVFARLPGSSERGDGGQIGEMEGGVGPAQLVGSIDR